MSLPRMVTRAMVPEGASEAEQRKAYLARAQHLAPGDRMVMELFFGRGLTRQVIARLLKVPVGTVSRRLTRLTARLQDPLVCALLDAPEGELSALHRSIGVGHFLCRTPVTHLARTHGMSARRVKQVVEYLRGWHSGTNGR